MNELFEWLAAGWVRCGQQVFGGIADGDRLADGQLLGYAEEALGVGGGGPRL
jgi:hypothetical protein